MEPGDILLDKPRFGAFYGTDLELILRARTINTISLVAWRPTFVVKPRRARRPSAISTFFFLSDGTETAAMREASAAELQRTTCITLGFLFAQVLTVNEMIRKIEAAVRDGIGKTETTVARSA